MPPLHHLVACGGKIEEPLVENHARKINPSASTPITIKEKSFEFIEPRKKKQRGERKGWKNRGKKQTWLHVKCKESKTTSHIFLLEICLVTWCKLPFCAAMILPHQHEIGWRSTSKRKWPYTTFLQNGNLTCVACYKSVLSTTAEKQTLCAWQLTWLRQSHRWDYSQYTRPLTWHRFSYWTTEDLVTLSNRTNFP